MAWSPGAFLFCRHDALKYGELENGRIKKEPGFSGHLVEGCLPSVSASCVDPKQISTGLPLTLWAMLISFYRLALP